MSHPFARSAALSVRVLWRLFDRRRCEKFTRNIKEYLPGRSDYAELCETNLWHKSLYFVEEVHLRWIAPRRIEEGCELVNPDLLDAHVAVGHKVLLTSAHQGNLDWVWLALSLRYPKADMAIVGRRFSSRWLDRHLSAMRGRFGKRQILDHVFGRQMLRRQATPDILCLVTDLWPVGTNISVAPTDFLAGQVVFYDSLPRVAARFGMHIVYGRVERLGYGRFRVRFLDLGPPPAAGEIEAVQAAYVRAVEQSIREDPASWLFWRWVGRWKPRR